METTIVRSIFRCLFNFWACWEIDHDHSHHYICAKFEIKKIIFCNIDVPCRNYKVVTIENTVYRLKKRSQIFSEITEIVISEKIQFDSTKYSCTLASYSFYASLFAPHL